ncbi:CDP-diacylglycerol--glycerol-3-phosphate 3-phosphatidyltransferase [Salisaeta longa]|uniref:CDP-diacylglycerol--glycerol-3-phosphate 3-phosphatidyltransferase n=1 Tax=Salisaeta longa TaxID=503170 RepID=UPI0003B403E8|nr:CDP-diacylglycerol--glycerol-3-phosphate 3-phosphatidyltransferase [Salisaeta longa]
MRHLPNILTIGRIVLTPLVLVLLSVPSLAAQAGAVVLFMAASASDYYDGVLARQMNVRSRLGQFLDPLADKFLVLGTFVAFAVLTPRVVPWWAVGLIALRDVVVTGLRSWVESQGRTLRTLRIAKWKTMLQLLFLWMLMLLRTAAHVPGIVGRAADWVLYTSLLPTAALVLVVAFTLGTGALYVLRPQEESMPADPSSLS